MFRSTAIGRATGVLGLVLWSLAMPAMPAAVAASAPGTPYSWGGNAFGELGDGSTVSRTTPAPLALDDVVDLHAGREHAIALRADGTVVTWGSNQMGQLGLGSTGGTRT